MQLRKVKFNLRIVAVMAVMLFSPVSGYGQSQAPGGTTEALDFFGELNRRWGQLVSPLARRQVVRRLRRLSNNFDDLANDKQDLAEALLSANPSADRGRIDARMNELQNTVQRLRRNIDEFSSLLPASHRDRGMDVARNLFDGLSEKWETLRRARQLLNGSRSVNSSEVSGELQSAVQIVLRLKAETNILIAQIENSQ